MKTITIGSNSLKELYKKHSSSTIPILFVISPGSDPSKELEELAEKTIGRDNFYQISMGGGQNEQALEKLREAADEGLWICLKNIHLVISFLPSLEKEFRFL